MLLSEAHVGRRYPTTPYYEVGREKLAEFADAIGDRNPIHRDPQFARSLEHVDVVAPLTFAVVLTRAAGWEVTHDPELGIDYSRVVHGEQRFWWLRPLVAGDRIRAEVAIQSLRTAAENSFLGLRAEVIDAAGDLVVVAESTLVIRGSLPGAVASGPTE